jgi:hypothetical protein
MLINKIEETNLKVKGIIESVIFTERNIIDWNEYKINILKRKWKNRRNRMYQI